MLKMLNTLQAQARRAQKLQGIKPFSRTRQTKPKERDPAQEAELQQAFELFDVDGSGFIDKNELAECMQSLGVTLGDSELSNLYAEMDPSGDGQVGAMAGQACPGLEALLGVW